MQIHGPLSTRQKVILVAGFALVIGMGLAVGLLLLQYFDRT